MLFKKQCWYFSCFVIYQINYSSNINYTILIVMLVCFVRLLIIGRSCYIHLCWLNLWHIHSNQITLLTIYLLMIVYVAKKINFSTNPVFLFYSRFVLDLLFNHASIFLLDMSRNTWQHKCHTFTKNPSIYCLYVRIYAHVKCNIKNRDVRATTLLHDMASSLWAQPVNRFCRGSFAQTSFEETTVIIIIAPLSLLNCFSSINGNWFTFLHLRPNEVVENSLQ